MRLLAPQELAAAAGGRLVQQGRLAQVNSVATDTRALRPGDLFVCLKGPNFDGHAFVDQALRAGVCGVVAQQEKPVAFPPHAHFVQVADTKAALMALAASERNAFAGPVIGVTGSHGKTTTKEWLRHLLTPFRALLTNEKNHNNELGVSLTWLRNTPAVEVAVIEMGMRGLGQIKELCDISQPTHGVITAVGSAHVGELGGPDKVAQAKAELFESLPPGGVAFAPCHVGFAELLASRTRARLVQVGEGGSLGVSQVRLLPQGGTRFVLRHGGADHDCKIPTWAMGQLDNLLLALAVCLELGIDLQDLLPLLASFEGVAERMKLVNVGAHRLLNDAYNASPESMNEALRVVAALPGDHRLLLLLGDMLELGRWSEEFHRGLAPVVLAAKPAQVFLVGSQMAFLKDELMRKNCSVPVVHGQTAADVRPAVQQVLANARPALLLVKSSHGVGLHELARELEAAA